MKKINNNGFMLTEAFIVSTFILSILVYMYTQFQTINNAYSKSFKYNNVQELYITNEVKKILETEYTKQISESFDNGFLNLYNYNEFSASYSFFLNNAHITNIILATENLDTDDLQGLKSNNLTNSDEMYDFIKYIKVDNNPNMYRIIVEFTYGTGEHIIKKYASLKVNLPDSEPGNI